MSLPEKERRPPINVDNKRHLLEEAGLSDSSRGGFFRCSCCGRRIKESEVGAIIQTQDGLKVICTNNSCLDDHERGINYP